jgi:hypothetical protein
MTSRAVTEAGGWSTTFHSGADSHGLSGQLVNWDTSAPAAGRGSNSRTLGFRPAAGSSFVLFDESVPIQR